MAQNITGTSVVGIKYNGGVFLASDTLASFGSLAKFGNFSRIHVVNEHTIIGVTGDAADFQYIQQILNNLTTQDKLHDDGFTKSPKAIHSYLTRLLYSRRTEIKPIWTLLVVAGFYKGESFLGYVDLRGLSYSDTTICTGIGSHLARPVLRNAQIGGYENLNEDDAYMAVNDALRVLFYRDCRAINKYEIARVDANGITITQPLSVSTNWDIAHQIIGF